MLDYRPTPKQRSTLELVQYMAIMAPAQIVSIKSGDFSRQAMMATWGAAEAASKAMSFEQAVAAIQKQSDELATMLNGWSEADFRGEVDLFGQKKFARLPGGEPGAVRSCRVSYAAFLLPQGLGPRRAQHL